MGDMPFVIITAEYSIAILELLGIITIMLFSLHATATNLYHLAKHGRGDDIFHTYRLEMARGILLGLEFLVAADIIKTVAIELTFASVGMLAIIVLIRTFLSFAIELEMTGNWPWQRLTL